MNNSYDLKRKKNFLSILFLYFMIYFCTGIIPVNIGNLLLYLPETTEIGIGVTIAMNFIVGIISILIFGYYGERIAEKFSRKKVFAYINLVWIISFGLTSLSLNFFFYLFFITISAIGTGAFLPLGFAMIGDFYPPNERGKKFGGMQFGMILGNGMGIIFGGLLGTYAGPLGWRISYGLGFVLGLLVLLFYVFISIEPEKGRTEPEFESFKGEIEYNYKITFNNLKQLFKTKTILGILISVLFAGIANATLGIWAIYYLSSKINGSDAELIATTLYILSGSGALPGSIIGGKLGDSYFNKGKINGRVIVSFLGQIIGVSLLMAFYLIPFLVATLLEVVFSWIFFLILGYLGFFFGSFSMSNQFAIYADVCPPEVRSTANAMNGLMVNIGGIFGNLLLSSLIEKNMSLLPLAISLVLFFYLFGSFFWLLTYFYYQKESKECRELLSKRRKELDRRDKSYS
ncbi:MAG: MFS transporter [Promethearchaeota archaeon]